MKAIGTTLSIHSSSSLVRFGSLTLNTGTNKDNDATNSAMKNGDGSFKSTIERLVVVRYFLDRPGYDINNSSSRIWINPPKETTPTDIARFLQDQGIKSNDDTTLLAELYLDEFHSYMLLEVCSDHMIHFDFTATTSNHPGKLDIRLTDLNELLTVKNKAGNATKSKSTKSAVPRCNTCPVGLFAFSMSVGFDSFNVLRKLLDDDTKIDASFLLIAGPYTLFPIGFLLFVAGLNEVTRSNIYGGTAFLGFGCFAMSNGTVLILQTYFPDALPDVTQYSTTSGAAATFVRECYILIFAFTLLKQTFAMSMVTTGLIGTLILFRFTASLSGWSAVFLWIKMISGFILSFYALFVFYAELTNEVYQRKVYNLHPWTKKSPVEVFGAAGRENMLHFKAINLRTAGHKNVLHPMFDSNTLQNEHRVSFTITH